MMERMMNKLKDRKGFTLVEIIVVLVILAILAAIAIPSVMGYVDDAKKSKYIADARSIYLACQIEEARYLAENNNVVPDWEKIYGDGDSGYGLNYSLNKKKDGKLSEVTGLKEVQVIHRGDIYMIYWLDDASSKKIGAIVNKNEKITIQ